MSRLATMVAGGVFPELAKAVNLGDIASGLTATGSAQADAYAVSKDVSWFSTVAASTGAVLPLLAEVGDEFVLVNAGANALSVYPPVGGNINGNTTNAAVSVASKIAGRAVRVNATDWLLIKG